MASNRGHTVANTIAADAKYHYCVYAWVREQLGPQIGVDDFPPDFEDWVGKFAYRLKTDDISALLQHHNVVHNRADTRKSKFIKVFEFAAETVTE